MIGCGQWQCIRVDTCYAVVQNWMASLELSGFSTASNSESWPFVKMRPSVLNSSDITNCSSEEPSSRLIVVRSSSGVSGSIALNKFPLTGAPERQWDDRTPSRERMRMIITVTVPVPITLFSNRHSTVTFYCSIIRLSVDPE